MIIKVIGPGGIGNEGLAAELMRTFKQYYSNYTIVVNKADEKYNQSLFLLAEELNKSVATPNQYMMAEFVVLHEPWGG